MDWKIWMHNIYKYKIEDSIKDCEPNGYGFDVIFKDGSVSEIAKLNVKY